MPRSNLTSIVFAITGFLVVGGVVYEALTFFGIIVNEWMRTILSIGVTLAIGVIIYLVSKKSKKNKMLVNGNNN